MTARHRASIIILVQRNPEHILSCLDSIEVRVGSTVSYETIVLFNGAEPSVVAEVQRSGTKARLLSLETNLGFSGGCNYAAHHAASEYLVFLNDDTMVEKNWLEALVAAADQHPEAGAVGSKILFLDGSVQEAGAVIWSDGSTAPLGRGLSPDSLAHHYVREVDYCSASSLLVRREVFERLGGFDELYFPAYYEDVDLCLGIRRLGMSVLYEPRSRIHHVEAASTESSFRMFLFRRNQRRLNLKWRAEIEGQISPYAPAALWSAMMRTQPYRRRILVIDDCIPNTKLGSGFGLMRELFGDLLDSEYSVTFYPSAWRKGDLDAMAGLRVEVIDVPLEEYLRRPEVTFSAAVISRPHNYWKHIDLIRALQPPMPIIYNAEALFFRRLETEAAQETDPERASERAVEAACVRHDEETMIVDADSVVTIATEEAAIASKWRGREDVVFLRPIQPDVRRTEAPFGERRFIVFVAGWLAGPRSPNAAALRWFTEEVLPYVVARVPWARLIVVGASPPENVRDLAGPHVEFMGYVDDLREIYERSLLAIAPLTFGAGVKIKTIEAMQYGVPVVATSIGAEGLGEAAHRALEIADDPLEFGAAVVRLLIDEQTWNSRRIEMLDVVERWLGEEPVRWTDIISHAIAAHRTTRGSSLDQGPRAFSNAALRSDSASSKAIFAFENSQSSSKSLDRSSAI
jgi:O-antigen biosynthesis protein